MQKIEYLENKIKDLNYELNFLKNEYTKIYSDFKSLDTQNYLLNSDFNINTRKSVVYENVESGKSIETVDKWYINKVGTYFPTLNLTLNSGSEFVQTLEEDVLKNIANQYVTLSINFDMVSTSGSVNICARVWINDSNYQMYEKEVVNTGISSLTFNIPINAVKVECFIKNNSNVQLTVRPKWAKLEKGSVFTNYSSPNFSLESIKCNKDKVSYVETLYDRDSNDSNINHGYKSGINSSNDITGFDFTKYKLLKFYTTNPIDSHVFYVDLTRLTTSATYYGAYTTVAYSGSSSYYYTSRCSIHANKKAFNITFTQNSNKRVGNSSYYCYRIEGII